MRQIKIRNLTLVADYRGAGAQGGAVADEDARNLVSQVNEALRGLGWGCQPQIYDTISEEDVVEIEENGEEAEPMVMIPGMTVMVCAKKTLQVGLYDTGEQAAEAAKSRGAADPAGTMKMAKGDTDTAVVLAKTQVGKVWDIALRTDAFGPCVIRDVSRAGATFMYTVGRPQELAL